MTDEIYQIFKAREKLYETTFAVTGKFYDGLCESTKAELYISDAEKQHAGDVLYLLQKLYNASLRGLCEINNKLPEVKKND